MEGLGDAQDRGADRHPAASGASQLQGLGPRGNGGLSFQLSALSLVNRVLPGSL